MLKQLVMQVCHQDVVRTHLAYITKCIRPVAVLSCTIRSQAQGELTLAVFAYTAEISSDACSLTRFKVKACAVMTLLKTACMSAQDRHPARA